MNRSVFVLFFIESLIQLVSPEAFFIVRFLTFRNPRGQDDSGRCCDEMCFSACDHSFTICLDQMDGPLGDFNHCTYGQFVSGEVTDANYINFQNTIGQLVNPQVWTFNFWPGQVLLKIDVVDVDHLGPPDHVSYLHKMISVVPTRSQNGQRLELTNSVQLTLETRVLCGRHYFGLDCGTFCESADDPRGHYSCEQENGTKICLTGWFGEDCKTNRDDCAGVVCRNGGRCVDLLDAFQCQCLPGFEGRFCQEEPKQCPMPADFCEGNAEDCMNGFKDGGAWCPCLGWSGALVCPQCCAHLDVEAGCKPPAVGWACPVCFNRDELSVNTLTDNAACRIVLQIIRCHCLSGQAASVIDNHLTIYLHGDKVCFLSNSSSCSCPSNQRNCKIDIGNDQRTTSGFTQTVGRDSTTSQNNVTRRGNSRLSQSNVTRSAISRTSLSNVTRNAISRTFQSNVTRSAISRTSLSNVTRSAISKTSQRNVTRSANSRTLQSNVTRSANSRTSQSNVTRSANSRTSQSNVTRSANSRTSQSNVTRSANSITSQSNVTKVKHSIDIFLFDRNNIIDLSGDPATSLPIVLKCRVPARHSWMVDQALERHLLGTGLFLDKRLVVHHQQGLQAASNGLVVSTVMPVVSVDGETLSVDDILRVMKQSPHTFSHYFRCAQQSDNSHDNISLSAIPYNPLTQSWYPWVATASVLMVFPLLLLVFWNCWRMQMRRRRLLKLRLADSGTSLWTKLSSSQTGRKEMSSSQTGRKELNSSQTGRKELSSSQTGRKELSSSQTGRKELSSSQTGRKELSSSQTGRKELSSSQTGRKEPSCSQTGPKELSCSQTGRKELSCSQTGPKELSCSQTGRKENEGNVAWHTSQIYNQPWTTVTDNPASQPWTTAPGNQAGQAWTTAPGNQAGQAWTALPGLRNESSSGDSSAGRCYVPASTNPVARSRDHSSVGRCYVPASTSPVARSRVDSTVGRCYVPPSKSPASSSKVLASGGCETSPAVKSRFCGSAKSQAVKSRFCGSAKSQAENEYDKYKGLPYIDDPAYMQVDL